MEQELQVRFFYSHLVYKEIFIDRIYDNFIFYALKKNYEKNLPLRIFDIGANLDSSLLGVVKYGNK